MQTPISAFELGIGSQSHLNCFLTSQFTQALAKKKELNEKPPELNRELQNRTIVTNVGRNVTELIKLHIC